MPVRDSTAWRHAILQKKIINFDQGGTYVMCGWDTCEKDGYECYKTRERISAPGYPLEYLTYVFCTEKHRQYWINSVIDCNNLPAGYKRSILLVGK